MENDKTKIYMKKILLLFFVNILLQTMSLAQVELKTNLLGALLEKPYLGVEYYFTKDLSLEFGVGAIFGKTINGRPRSGSNILLAGKYHFNTRWGIDRYFVGFYLRPQILLIKNNKEYNFDDSHRNSGVATGFICGRKWSNKKVSFEVNLGLGKIFGNSVYLNPYLRSLIIVDVDMDVLFNINIGYRFSKN